MYNYVMRCIPLTVTEFNKFNLKMVCALAQCVRPPFVIPVTGREHSALFQDLLQTCNFMKIALKLVQILQQNSRSY